MAKVNNRSLAREIRIGEQDWVGRQSVETRRSLMKFSVAPESMRAGTVVEGEEPMIRTERLISFRDNWVIEVPICALLRLPTPGEVERWSFSSCRGQETDRRDELPICGRVEQVDGGKRRAHEWHHRNTYRDLFGDGASFLLPRGDREVRRTNWKIFVVEARFGVDASR